MCVHNVTPNRSLYYFPCRLFGRRLSFHVKKSVSAIQVSLSVNRMLFYTQDTGMGHSPHTHGREHITFVAKTKLLLFGCYKKKKRRFACFYRALTSHVLKNCGQYGFDCQAVSLHLIIGGKIFAMEMHCARC